MRPTDELVTNVYIEEWTRAARTARRGDVIHLPVSVEATQNTRERTGVDELQIKRLARRIPESRYTAARQEAARG